MFVYKLITVGTVEEKILELQNKKRILLEGLFSEEGANKFTLAAAELQELFGN